MSGSPQDIENLFSGPGAVFNVPAPEIARQVAGIKGFIFDWDGVFNAGVKADDQGSPFSEIDSMGINMLRFSYYLKFGFIPQVFIVTGENNQPALRLSQREHFNGVYSKTGNKLYALNHITGAYAIAPASMAFIFDDILDLGLAAKVALRYFVKQPAAPMLQQYIRQHQLAEYYTANTGGHHAVREICELTIALLGNYDQVVQERNARASAYPSYIEARNKIITRYHTLENGRITGFTPQ